MPTHGTIKTSAPRDVYQTIDAADIEKIDTGENIRHSIPQSRIESRAESIAENGQITPAPCALKPDGSFRLLGGRTRMEAVRFIRDNFEYYKELYGLLEPPKFRIVVRAEIEQKNWLAVMIADNQQDPLSIPDQVEVVRQAKKMDWEDEKIAKSLGISMAQMKQTLLPLMRAGAGVLDALQDGLLTKAGALATLDLDESEVKARLDALRADQEAGKVGITAGEELEARGEGDGLDDDDDDLEGGSTSATGTGKPASSSSTSARDAAKPTSATSTAKSASTPTPSSTSKRDGRTVSKAVKEVSRRMAKESAAKKAAKSGVIPAMTLKEVLETLEFLMQDHIVADTGREHEECPYAYFLYSAIKREPGEDGVIPTLQQLIYEIHEATGGLEAWDNDEILEEGEFEMKGGKVVPVAKNGNGIGAKEKAKAIAKAGAQGLAETGGKGSGGVSAAAKAKAAAASGKKK